MDLTKLTAGRVVGGGEHYVGNVPFTTLTFIDGSRLLYTFVTRAPTTQLAGAGGGSSYLLRGILIDPATGRVTATYAWPAHNRETRVIAANDESIVVYDWDSFSLISVRTLEVTATLRPPPPYRDSWGALASWDGNYLLLGFGKPGTKVPFAWIDARTLRILHQWRWTDWGGVALSDTLMLMIESWPDYAVYERDLDSPWHPLQGWDGDEGTVGFVGPELLLWSDRPYQIPPGPVFFSRLDGTGRIPVPTVPKGRWLIFGGVTRDGRRFLLDDMTKPLFGPERRAALLVFDNGPAAPTYELPLAGNSFREHDYALSPDGRYVAIASLERVLVYALPPVAAPQPPN